MRVSIFGLGYVGCVSVACLSRQGHKVVGVDIVPAKVGAINAGLPTVVEPELDDLMAAGHRLGRIGATSDAAAAVLESDASLICVGTPSGRDGALDLSAIADTARCIGQALERKQGHHLIILRSTVPPGTMENLLLPTMMEASGRSLDDISIVIIPEFLREGTAVKDYYQPPLAVVGTADGHPNGCQGEVASLLAVDPERIQWVTYRQAELLKSVCNVFHALKVAFGNEIGALCSALSIDGRQLMALLVQDRKLNISPAYLRPGMPFGGSCLPKDLAAVVALANQACVDTPLLRSIAKSNEVHKKRTCEAAVQGNGYRRVGMDGLAFKQGTDDLRESPLVTIAEYLLGKGYDLRILDPAVSTARLHGANKEYIDRHVPHLASRLVGTYDELLEHSEVLILTRDGNELYELASQLVHPPLVIDLTGAGRTSPDGCDELLSEIAEAAA